MIKEVNMAVMKTYKLVVSMELFLFSLSNRPPRTCGNTGRKGPYREQRRKKEGNALPET
jgi:hypothetical protein